tara:strand:- start:1186 stop:1728 length:543 start_codon:yes stop_codon:yes gene_type:complete
MRWMRLSNSKISNRSNGFTLIELLTVMAVSVVLLGIGVPNLVEFLDRSRASAEAREFIRTVGLARSEAISRGENVNLSAISGSNWEQGFRLWIDADADNTYDAGEEIREISGFKSNADLSVTNNTTTFTFTSEGFLDTAVGSESVFSYQSYPGKCNSDVDRSIRLKHTGHVSIEDTACSP